MVSWAMLLLFPCAFAAIPATLGGDVLIQTPQTAQYAQLMLNARGEPRILEYTNQRVASLSFVDQGAWFRLEVPNGALVQGPTDLVLLLDPSLGQGQRLRLDAGLWVPAPGLSLPLGSVIAVALDQKERAQVITWGDGGPVMMWETADSWRSQPVTQQVYNNAWAQAGALWWLTEQGLGGPKPIKKDMRGIQGLPTAGLDASGEPALVWWEPGTIHVQHRKGHARHTMPPDKVVELKDCVEAPCQSIAHYPSFVQGGGIVPFAGGLLLPYLHLTVDQEEQCRPYTGPYMPCDPVRSMDDCPSQPQWSCDTTRAELREPELRLLWVQGERTQDQPLSELVELDVVEGGLWDVAADEQGSVHLLVWASAPRAGLHYLRLDPAPGRPPPPAR